MKISLLVVVILLLSGQLFASQENAPKRINGLLRFIANQGALRDIGLYGILAKRCGRYLPTQERKPCREAIQRQIKILDYDIIFTGSSSLSKRAPVKMAWHPDSFVFIAFKRTLISTLSDPRTAEYLEQLKLGLNDFLTGAKPQFNIWDMSLNFYRSPLIAARTIAALFQDTSVIKLHLAYLERSQPRGNAIFDSNLEKLSKTIDTINLILDYSEDHYRGLFYPPLREHLNRNIYHFYVPLYLTMALASEGHSRKQALTGPMMLTLTYEFVTLASDYRYLLKDPERIDPNITSSTLKDIFAGFSGASFGIGKDAPSETFTLMKKHFAYSTKEGVRFLLHSSTIKGQELFHFAND